MKRASSGSSEGWERIWAAGPSLEGYWSEADPAVVEWARGLGPGVRRVLDLGCGMGRHTLLFARMGFQTLGSDVSPSGLAGCAARMVDQGFSPWLARHDMARLPFGEATFDALLSFHVIYHTTLAGLRAAVEEIRRVLRRGGQVYLTFLGRAEENIRRYRADVARGICREVEPFTFIYVRDAPGDKDVLHHYVDEGELRDLLAGFDVEALVPVRQDSTDEHGTRYVSVHYHVQARRPRA